MADNINNINNRCVYFHINPIKQEVFYVGIGTLTRPYSKYERGKFWKDTAKKYGYDIIILHENLSRVQACELEIKYIAQIGRRDKGLGSLVNLTDGGDIGGTWNGKKHSLESRLKMRLAKIGKKQSTETRLKRSISQKGIAKGPFSKEHRLKLSLVKRGKSLSTEHKLALKVSHKSGGGVKHHTEEAKNKIRISSTGRKYPGRVLTEQDKLNKSIAAKKRWAIKKGDICG